MSEKTKKLLKRVEFILLFSTAGVSLVISILDISGLLDSSSWVAQRIPVITLLCVGFVASYLILERRGKIDEIAESIQDSKEAILTAISKSTTDAVRSLDGVDAKTYSTREDFARVFANRVKKAKRVDDLVWDTSSTEPVSKKDIDAVATYSEVVEKVLSKPDIVWREIVAFTKRRFERSERRILDNRIKGFNVGYIEPPLPDDIPRLSFMIVDNEDLFLFHLPNAPNLRMYIKHPDIVHYFSKYYEALWDYCVKLKQGQTIDHQRLDELRLKWS